MTSNQTSRNFVNRLQPRRRIQRLVHIQGATSHPSEQAIRSIQEPRSTFRW